MKILIAVPTFESIYPDTFKAIWNIRTNGHSVDFDFIRGYDCAKARNNIAQKTKDASYDYILMIDNDITPPEDALLDLLDGNLDVVLGYYAHRNSDNIYDGTTCICKLNDPTGHPYFNYPIEGNYKSSELNELWEAGSNKVKIHGGGMGCALIRTNIFDRLKYPWFKWVNYDDGGVLSEDLYFCEQCKDAGIPIYTDTRVKCGHMMRHLQEVI